MKNTRILYADSRYNFYVVLTMGKFIHSSKWIHYFKKTRLRTRRHLLREYATVTSFDISSYTLLLQLRCAPFILSRFVCRCRTGFVNHAVRIARIIPRRCGIIKEVLPGTISASSPRGSTSPIGNGGWRMIRLDCTDPRTPYRGKPPSFDMSLPLPKRCTDSAVLSNYPGFQLISINCNFICRHI